MSTWNGQQQDSSRSDWLMQLSGRNPDQGSSLSDVKLLTVKEIALIMRVSGMTVYRLVHNGELESIRVGRSFRVPAQAVNKYLRAAFTRTPERM